MDLSGIRLPITARVRSVVRSKWVREYGRTLLTAEGDGGGSVVEGRKRCWFVATLVFAGEAMAGVGAMTGCGIGGVGVG